MILEVGGSSPLSHPRSCSGPSNHRRPLIFVHTHLRTGMFRCTIYGAVLGLLLQAGCGMCGCLEHSLWSHPVVLFYGLGVTPKSDVQTRQDCSHGHRTNNVSVTTADEQHVSADHDCGHERIPLISPRQSGSNDFDRLQILVGFSRLGSSQVTPLQELASMNLPTPHRLPPTCCAESPVLRL